MISVQDRRVIIVHEPKIGAKASYALGVNEIMDAIQARDNAWLQASLDDDMSKARARLQWRLLGYVWVVALLWVLFFSR